MAGPRVTGGRPDPAAAGGEFTKAFANVLDAIQAGRQAAALEEQIRSTERMKRADFAGQFLSKTLERRAGEVGESQAAAELADDIGSWLTSQGYDGSGYTSRAKATYASGKESPTRLVMRDMSAVLALTPEQIRPFMQATSQPEAPPTEEAGEISETGEPPEAPVMKAGVLSTPIGPDTPEKRTTISEAIAAAQAAGEGDYSPLEKLLAGRRAVDRISKAQEAGSTQAQRQQYADDYMAQPDIQAKYQWLFGPTWKEDFADVAFGTREKRIEAESRMMSAQSAVDKETLTLVIAAIKEAGDTKRQLIMASAMRGVAETNQQGAVDVKTIDQETQLLRENDEAIQNSWKEIGDLFMKMGEPQARQSQKYKELIKDIARRMKLKPENRGMTVDVIQETIEEPGTFAAIQRLLKLGGTTQVPTIDVKPPAPAAPTAPPVGAPQTPAAPSTPTRGSSRQPNETPAQYQRRLLREARELGQ